MTDKADNKKAFREIACDLLSEGISIRLEASGYSMYPAIKPDNIIHIDPVTDVESLFPGDIVAWKREKDIVVHRLVHLYSSGDELFFISRGDSSPSSDKPLSINAIAGRVVLIESGNLSRKPKVKAHIPEWKYWLKGRMVWFVSRFKKLLSIISGH